MDKDKLNRWLTLIANIGVLIGIILLLVELNQTQEIARAQIRNEMYQGIIPVTIVSRDYAQVIAKANSGENLDATEAIMVSGFSEQIHRYWENANYQYNMGLYDETEYSEHKNTIRVAILDLFSGSLIPHYCMNREGFSESYRAMIDEFVTPQMCSN